MGLVFSKWADFSDFLGIFVVQGCRVELPYRNSRGGRDLRAEGTRGLRVWDTISL